MISQAKNLHDIRKGIVFGEVILSEKEEYFYGLLNSRISELCRSLPEHVQNKTMFFMLNYSHVNIGEPQDFFKNFYKPVWTIIPSMAESGSATCELSKSQYKTASAGQAMTLFMHSLDDHLNDGEVAPSHLLLLLRSQGWLLLREAISEFAVNKDERELADFLVNQYYEGMYPDKEPVSLDEYCDLFKKEISTWYIMPMLAAKKVFGNMEAAAGIKKAMEHFGVAWRLLDDIQDAEEDLSFSRHTALYHSLPADAKMLWDSAAHIKAGGSTVDDIRERVYRELSDGNRLGALLERIVRELDEASIAAEALGMQGLSEQYKALGKPVKNML
jgi:hypothetical protein